MSRSYLDQPLVSFSPPMGLILTNRFMARSTLPNVGCLLGSHLREIEREVISGNIFFIDIKITTLYKIIEREEPLFRYVKTRMWVCVCCTLI